MKARFIQFAVPAIAIFALASCASERSYARATESLRRGDRSGAVMAAAEALSYSNTNYKALDLLEATFPDAVAEMRTRAASARAGDDALKWEKVADSLGKIHAMNDAIRALPPLFRKDSKTPVLFSFEYYHDALVEANEKAAENRYEEGKRLLARGQREDARAAYSSFMKALAFSPGFRDSVELAATARSEGSIDVAVVPFGSVQRGSDASYFSTALYEGCLAEFVKEASSRLFLRIVERSRLESLLKEQELSVSDFAAGGADLSVLKLNGADIIIFGQLMSLSMQGPEIRSRTESFEVEVVEPIPGAAPVNGVAPTQKTMKRASVTVYSERSSVSASASYRAVDRSSSVILLAKTILDEAEDKYEWARLTGDKEATPERYASLLAAPSGGMVKSPVQLMPDLASRMGRSIAIAIAKLIE